MKAAGNQAQKDKLIQQPLAELEKKFADTKLLSVNNNLNNYLQEIVKYGRASEIFLTDPNGFNIAYSNPPSDFVQRDEDWWQTAQQQGLAMDEPEFDESAKTNVIAFSKAVKNIQTGELLGVTKAAIPLKALSSDLSSEFNGKQQLSSDLQIVDVDEGFVLYQRQVQKSHSQDQQQADVEAEQTEEESVEIIGGQPILEVIETMLKVKGNSLSLEALEEIEESENMLLSLEQAEQSIDRQPGFSEVNFGQEQIFSETITLASFKYQNNLYTVSTVPKTDFVSIDVVNYDVVIAEARNLLSLFVLTAIFLGIITLSFIILLAQQLSKPLANLSTKAQQVAAGNLDTRADLEGTLETRTLADNFNQLVSRVKNLLQEQKEVADEQRQAKEKLELAIYTLIDEVSDATEGDLTVRTNLNSLELSTVADLFNAIIDNLQEIAIEAKQSTSQVGSSLKQNEAAILALAEQALAEAKETRDILMSVEQMSQSIREVAENASQAEKIADDTYNTIVNSTDNMNLTVNSILELRNTVGETAKKMKRLGESSQKISQAVSFIEEIALKTNVLAINASVEAGRAGEYGQGFTIVAEQVGALAAQSATATKEIASIVAAI
ncbi:MAG: methyl-accepting chemotaxis protein, partial [Waterburya sp.]